MLHVNQTAILDLALGTQQQPGGSPSQGGGRTRTRSQCLAWGKDFGYQAGRSKHHPSGVRLPRGAQAGEQYDQICILESSAGQCVGEITVLGHGRVMVMLPKISHVRGPSWNPD